MPISIESLHFYRDRLWLRSPRQFAEFDPAGKVLWSAALGGTCHGSPVAAGGRLIVGCDDGNLYAFREKGE